MAQTQLSWQTIVGALTAVALLAGAQWTIFQSQFLGVEKTAANDRVAISEMKASFDKYLTIREHTEYREGMAYALSEVSRRLTVVERELAKAAHEPVEDRTFQAVSKATDDRVTLLQNQITDINRQIAAALVIIDNNSGSRKSLPP